MSRLRISNVLTAATFPTLLSLPILVSSLDSTRTSATNTNHSHPYHPSTSSVVLYTTAGILVLSTFFVTYRYYFSSSSNPTQNSIPIMSPNHQGGQKQDKETIPCTPSYDLTVEIPVHQVFSSAELQQLTRAQDEIKPPGKFFQGRHGYTHYVIDSPNPSSNDPTAQNKSKGILVMAHGLGTSLQVYRNIAHSIVTQTGYSVLRYDYFGHGYSRYGGKDMWVAYTPEMLVDQLEDLLDHVVLTHTLNTTDTEPNVMNMIAFVGHSTGGLVGIYAAHRWMNRKLHSMEAGRTEDPPTPSLPYCIRSIPKLILLSPALWADKPLIAQIADRIPNTLTGLIRTIPSLQSLIIDSYTDFAKIAFARDTNTKRYMYPEEELKQRLIRARLFGQVKGIQGHLFLPAAILGLNCHTLRGDLYPQHCETLVQVLKQASAVHQDNTTTTTTTRTTDGKKGMDRTSHVLFVWGDHDLGVPYIKNVANAHQWEKEYPTAFTLKVLDRIGHEMIYENDRVVANVIISYLS